MNLQPIDISRADTRLSIQEMKESKMSDIREILQKAEKPSREILNPATQIIMTSLTAFFDGSCELNRGIWGQASYGAIIFRGRETIWECSRLYNALPGEATSNNVAEYLGFIAILDHLKESALDHEPRTVIFGDSNLVIQQMTGKWKIKSGAYAFHAIRARAVLETLSRQPIIKWIPREQNSIANGLSKPATAKARLAFEDLSMTIRNLDLDRELIRKAMVYHSGPDSCNSLYMGSMSTAMLYRIIGATYGKYDFEEHLVKASRAILDEALIHCEYIIKYMEEHPTTKCPTCGGVVSK